MARDPEYMRRYYAENRERIRAQQAAHRSDPEVRERILAQNRAAHARRVAAGTVRRAPTEYNTEKAWRLRLARQGLTPEDYHRILAEQGGGCAICGTTDPGKAGNGKADKFAADHCHNTGRSRGLLCHRCNRGLGYFGDDPEMLRAAARYLER